MVVRTPCWRPQAGDEVTDVILRPRARVKMDPPGRLKAFLKLRLEKFYGRENGRSFVRGVELASNFYLFTESRY